MAVGAISVPNTLMGEDLDKAIAEAGKSSSGPVTATDEQIIDIIMRGVVHDYIIQDFTFEALEIMNMPDN